MQASWGFFDRLHRGISSTSVNTERCWVSHLLRRRPTRTRYRPTRRSWRPLLPRRPRRRRRGPRTLRRGGTASSLDQPAATTSHWSSSPFCWSSSLPSLCRCGLYRLELVGTFCLTSFCWHWQLLDVFNPLKGTVKPQSNGRWLEHWPLMGGLLHSVHPGGSWVGR